MIENNQYLIKDLMYIDLWHYMHAVNRILCDARIQRDGHTKTTRLLGNPPTDEKEELVSM